MPSFSPSQGSGSPSSSVSGAKLAVTVADSARITAAFGNHQFRRLLSTVECHPANGMAGSGIASRATGRSSASSRIRPLGVISPPAPSARISSSKSSSPSTTRAVTGSGVASAGKPTGTRVRVSMPSSRSSSSRAVTSTYCQVSQLAELKSRNAVVVATSASLPDNWTTARSTRAGSPGCAVKRTPNLAGASSCPSGTDNTLRSVSKVGTGSSSASVRVRVTAVPLPFAREIE